MTRFGIATSPPKMEQDFLCAVSGRDEKANQRHHVCPEVDGT